MAFDFKKLSDVEVVAEPTESANVLIEEDGVIKKAPKTAVGGNGEWDAIIHLEGGFSMDTVDTFTLVEGSYEKILNILTSKEAPKINIYWHYQYGDYYDINIIPISIVHMDGDSYIRIAFYLYNSQYYFYLFSDNTISNTTGEEPV